MAKQVQTDELNELKYYLAGLIDSKLEEQKNKIRSEIEQELTKKFDILLTAIQDLKEKIEAGEVKELKELSVKQEEILKLLYRQVGGVGVTEVKKELGISDVYAYKLLNDLVNRGLVDVERKRRKINYFIVPEKAEKLLSKKLKTPEEDGERHLNLSSIKFTQGKIDEAIELANKAISIFKSIDSKKKIGECHLALHKYYLRKGELDKAERELINSEELFKVAGDKESLFNVYSNLGFTNFAKGKFDESIYYLNKAMSIKPDSIDAYHQRGNVYSHMKKYEMAIKDFTEIIELDHKHAAAYYNRGNAYSYKKEYDKAIEDYDNAIELDPKNAKAYYNRGLAYSHKKEYDKAIEDYTKAIDLDPKLTEAHNNRGIVYWNKKEYDKAIEDYDKVIELNPKDAEAYDNRGNAYSDKKEYDKAIEDISTSIQLVPNNPNAYDSIGEVYFRLKDFEKALENFKKATKLFKKEFELAKNYETGVEFCITLKNLAKTYFALNKIDDANKSIQEAKDLFEEIGKPKDEDLEDLEDIFKRITSKAKKQKLYK